MQTGVQRHDRVAILLDNSPEAVISIFGILKAGAAFVPLEGSLKGPKLSYILDHCGARLLITHVSKRDEVRKAFQSLATSCKILWVKGDKEVPEEISTEDFSWEGIFSVVAEADVSQRLPRAIDVDLAGLIYTSGSTGLPKGVMSTHHNMVSAARSIIQYIGNSEDDIILNVLPLSFDYGLYQIIMAFMFGGTVVLGSSFIYLDHVLKSISQERVTGFPVVPTIVALLLRMKDLSHYDFSTLRYMTNTGAALPPEHIREFRHLLPDVKIFSMFGLTECKRVSYLDPDLLDEKAGSVGRAMPNCETFIVDEDGNDTGAGEVGELVVRGSNVMQGYWDDPESTASTYQDGLYPADRRLRSGDYFKRDGDGLLYFLERKDDLIKVRGERVDVKEVENTVYKMDGVAEAAVIGIPDDVLGQAVVAFVLPKSEHALSEKDVMKFCTQRLETFAVPKRVRIVSSLPRTANGKIDKARLKEEIKNANES